MNICILVWQVAANKVQVLNSVNAKLPFLVTTADDAKDSLKEEIRLRLVQSCWTILVIAYLCFCWLISCISAVIMMLESRKLKIGQKLNLLIT